jgi:hypothetical protein
MDSHKVIVKDDEIDLLNLISSLASLIKKYVYVITVIIALSTLIGFVLFKRTTPYFKAQMIADSGTLPNKEVINIVEYWQTLIGKGDYVTLAAKLNLSVAAINKINKIEAEDTQNGEIQATKNENSFMISTIVTDVQILDSLESAIVYALENNEYVKKRSAIKRQNLESLKNKISAEVIALDSVKNSVKQFLSKDRPASGTFFTSPSEVNLQIVALYERILDLETSIKLSEDIQVIENFTKTTKPDGPDLMPYLTYGFIIGCLLSIIFIIYKLLINKFKYYASTI